MKTQILIVVSIVFTVILTGLISCSDKKLSPNEIVRKNAEEYLKTKMDDPQSYEFVKLELVDSILYSDNIESRRKYFKANLQYDKDQLERQESYKTEIPSMYHENEVNNLKNKIINNEKILTAIDSLELLLGGRKNDVASYTYLYSFRGNNKLGTKVINEFILQTNTPPEFKVINFTDDKDKVYLTPNNFPGYMEMIQKYK